MVFSPSGGGEVTLDINAEDNASGSIDDIAGSLGSMRGAAAAAGTALAAIGIGGLTAATGAAIDFEEAMVEVEKVTSETMSENLEDDIRGIAEATRLTHGEVATLASQAARFGAEGEEEIAAFTETAAEMGAATTLASDEAGRALAKTATALGVPLSDVRTLGDAINETSNNFAASSQEIVDSAQRSGASLRSLGLREDEIIGVAAAFNEVSPTSRRAATMMKQVSESMMSADNIQMFADSLNMTAEEFKTLREESPEEAMVQLMEATQESDETMTAFRENLTTAQARAFQRGAANTDAFREAMETSNQAMEEGGSLADENAADVSTLAGQMDLLSSRVTTAAQKIGEQLVPVLVDAMDAAMPAIDAFIEFNDKTNGMAGVAVLAGTTLAGLATAIAAVAPVIASVIPSIGAITGAVTTAAGAITTVIGILGGPLTVAILAIVALLGTLWYAWNNNIGNIQGKVNDFVSSIKASFGIIADELNEFVDIFTDAFTSSGDEADKFGGTIDRVTKAVNSTVEFMANTVGAALEHIADVVNWLVVNHYQPMMDRLQKVTERHLGPMVDEFIETFNVVMSRLERFADAFLAVFNWFTDTTMDLWERYGDQILAVIRPILKTLRIMVEGALDGIMTTIRVVLAIIRGDWGEAWDLIKGYLSRTLDRMGAILDNAIEYIQASWDLFTTVLSDTWDALWKGIENILSNAWNSMVSFITGIGQDDIYNAFYAVGQAIRGVFKTLKKWLIGAGGFIQGIVGDITDYIKTDAKTDTKQAFGSMLDSARESFDNLVEDVIGAGGTVKSMIRDIATYLKNDAWNDLKEASEILVDSIWSAFTGLYDGLIGNSLIPDMIGDIASFLKNTGKQILKNAFNNMLGGMMDALGSFSEDVMDTMGNIAQGIGDTIGGAIDGAEETINSAIDDLTSELESSVESAVSGAESYINNQIDDAQDALDDVSETTNDWVSDTSDDISDTGGDIVDSGSDWVDDAVDSGSDAWDDATDTANDWVDDAQDVVDDTVSGVGDAVDDAVDTGTDWASDVGSTIGDTVNDVIDTGSSWADDAVDTGSDWASGAGDAVDDAADTVSDAADAVGGWFGFANGGIVTSPVMGMIGEAGESEAVVPLDRLSTMMDTSFEAGASASNGGGNMTVTLNVEGDDELTRLIRENARVEVEKDNQNKRDRLRRF